MTLEERSRRECTVPGFKTDCGTRAVPSAEQAAERADAEDQGPAASIKHIAGGHSKNYDPAQVEAYAKEARRRADKISAEDIVDELDTALQRHARLEQELDAMKRKHAADAGGSARSSARLSARDSARYSARLSARDSARDSARLGEGVSEGVGADLCTGFRATVGTALRGGY